jgi:monofunctional biosynthetic peptidoglycan transglycosylase
LGCILLCLVLLIAGCVAYEVATWPDIARLAAENPATTAWMEMRAAEARAKRMRPRRVQTWVPLTAISPHLTFRSGRR